MKVVSKICLGGFLSLLIIVTLFGQYGIKKVQSSAKKFTFKNGDILLQTGTSRQCQAVKAATHSEYTHCGIYLEDNGIAYVYEAVQPVKKTPLNEWIEQGQFSKYTVVRLRRADSLLTKPNIEKLKDVAESYLDEDYDIFFDWSDEEMYCSEYVWKIYKKALNIEVGSPKKIKDFDLTNPLVKTIMKERYGNTIPYDEKVVAPSDFLSAPNVDIVN